MMENNIDEIEDLMVRYLDGSATTEEKEFLLQWLEASEEHRQQFHRTREVWFASEVAFGNESEIQSAWSRLRTRTENFTPVQQKSMKSQLLRWTQTAAVILLLVSLGYGLSVLIPLKKNEIVQHELITAKGSKGCFTLPDGSTVWLNSESKLIYPNTFNEKTRTVTLEGEAYFTVAENKTKPFVVQTGDVTVEALGTSFDVSNYAYNEQIKTVLLTGKVKINQSHFTQPVLLSPSYKLTYDKDSRKTEIVSTKASLYVDWIKERLTFDNNRLSDIIISLNGYYNVDIECPKSFAENTYLTFTVQGENIQEILQAMSYIIPIRYKIEEHHIQLTTK